MIRLVSKDLDFITVWEVGSRGGIIHRINNIIIFKF